MKKISFILSILIISLITSCLYHPDYIIGYAGDYEEIHNTNDNPLYKGKGFYEVAYSPDGVYKKYNSSYSFQIMEDGEFYFDKSTFKSGLISVYLYPEDENKNLFSNNYHQLFTGSFHHTHEPVKKGDKIRVEVEMEPYFTTKKNEKFYEFSVYLADY